MNVVSFPTVEWYLALAAVLVSLAYLIQRVRAASGHPGIGRVAVIASGVVWIITLATDRLLDQERIFIYAIESIAMTGLPVRLGGFLSLKLLAQGRNLFFAFILGLVAGVLTGWVGLPLLALGLAYGLGILK